MKQWTNEIKKITVLWFVAQVKSFGPIPKNWKNEHFIVLHDKVMSLSFNDELKLFKVEIFRPNAKNNR